MADARILIVEDENIVAKDIQIRLEKFGYEVPGMASSGEVAIRKAEETQPDLVLMDIMLKGQMTGVEAAEQIRSQLDIPVIYLTAYSDSATLERAKVTEPFGYVLKPFEEKELHTAIEISLYRHRMEVERRRFQAQLVQIQKTEALGHLKAGFAHHFNNALMAIVGNIELAQITPSEAIQQYLERARSACLGAAEIVDALLLFCRKKTMGKAVFNISDTVRRVALICRPSFGGEIEIALTGIGQKHLVFGDEERIQQAILNLCLNARDALESVAGPLSRLSIDVETVAARAPDSGNGYAAQFVKISVKDTGIGMDETVQQHLFEPFFTTKGVGSGMGLGLAVAHGIVQEHSGWMDWETQIGERTTFNVYLPAIATPTRESVPA